MPNVTVHVALGEGDGSEAHDGTMNISGSAVELKSSPTDPNQFAAVIPLGVVIPRYSTIVNAYSSIYAYFVDFDANCRIYFEKSASPALLTTIPFDITNRPKTLAHTPWVQDDLPKGWVNSPSLVAPAQELVNFTEIDTVCIIMAGNSDVAKTLGIRTKENGNDIHLYLEWELPVAGPPVVAFEATPTTGTLPLQVSFTNKSYGGISSYLWDFGDGETSEEASPVHTYLVSGFYTVRLTATGPDGEDYAEIDIIAAGDKTSGLGLELIPTYECIGVYASFGGDLNGNNSALMEWRLPGGGWKVGIPMTPDRRPDIGGVPNPYYNQWRASIFGLTPNTTYEVRVTLTDPNGVDGRNPLTASVTTRNDDFDSLSGTGTTYHVDAAAMAGGDGTEGAPFNNLQDGVNAANMPGDTVLVRGGAYVLGTDYLLMSSSGDPFNYITVRAYPGEAVTLDLTASMTPAQYGPIGIWIRASYIRFKGFDIIGSHRIGIYGGPETSPSSRQVHDVVIEDCNFFDYKTLASAPGPYQPIRLGALSNSWESSGTGRFTIQNNNFYIVEPGATVLDDISGWAVYFIAANGGNVVRGNKIYYSGTLTIHGSDGIVDLTYKGIDYGLRDSDLYNNYIFGATDDGISLDSNGMNVRVWGNFLHKTNTGFSGAPVVVGPTYVVRNVVFELVYHWANLTFFKGGESGTGHIYFWHNTFVASNLNAGSRVAPGTVYLYTCLGGDTPSINVHTRNNIVELDGYTFLEKMGSPTHDWDYDLIFNPLLNSTYSYWGKWDDHNYGNKTNTSQQNLAEYVAVSGQEVHAIPGAATFVDKANGDLRLAPGSLGIGVAQLIPGINDADSPWPFEGDGPDMGALETGEAGSPIAVFAADPIYGKAPLEVSFTNHTVGSVVSFLWDFGDGETSEEVSPVHTYDSPGTFHVVLTANGPSVPSVAEVDVVVTAGYFLTLDQSPAAGGTTTPAPGMNEYGEGEVVNLVATPAVGYEFAGWRMGGTIYSTDASTFIVMNGDKYLTAMFKKPFQINPNTILLAGGLAGVSVAAVYVASRRRK